MRLAGLAAAMLILAFAASCASTSSDMSKKDGGCAGCTAIKMDGEGWCAGYNKGMVGGKWTKCKGCFKGKTGEATWCKGCKKGYVKGKPVKCKGCFTAMTGGPKCAGCSK